MGKYSQPDLVITQFLAHSILKELSIPALQTFFPLNVLVLVRVLNDRKVPSNLLKISICMSINKKGNSRVMIMNSLRELVAAGYVTGKTNFRVTELGRAQLHYIDQTLQRAVIRVSVKDNLFTSLPISKKGRKPRALGDI